MVYTLVGYIYQEKSLVYIKIYSAREREKERRNWCAEVKIIYYE